MSTTPSPTTHVRYVSSGRHHIPVVSLAAASSGELAVRQALSRELADVCRHTGFFCVENHGIPQTFLTDARAAIERFFLLPVEDKMEIHIAKSPYHRGYHPLGEENALGSEVHDLKEVFDMALELSTDDPAVLQGKPFHGPNAWPAAFPEFKPLMLRLYDEWRALCGRISALFALSFGLPESYFVERSDKPMCQLRAAKYPPQHPPSDLSPIGCGAHTDYGVVSTIWQIDVPGLQLRNTEGEWVNAPVIPQAFVCPIGDMTEMVTNGEWKATVHRVINITGETRHSSAFFFDPNYDCEIVPVPAFVGADRPARYPRTTMGAHVARGFNGTFKYRNRAPEAQQ